MDRLNNMAGFSTATTNTSKLTPVNCGKTVMVNGILVEIMGVGYSSHPMNITASYGMVDGVKVSMDYAGGNEIIQYRFRSARDSQHYWSRKYNIEQLRRDPRYTNLIDAAVMVYNQVFLR